MDEEAFDEEWISMYGPTPDKVSVNFHLNYEILLAKFRMGEVCVWNLENGVLVHIL